MPSGRGPVASDCGDRMSRTTLHHRLLGIELTLYRWVRAICITLLCLIVATVSAAVFARFIVFTPLNFADPLSKYLMQWMSFLGVGLAMKRGEHVLVETMTGRLPVTLQKILSVMLSCIVVVLFAVILRHGITNALSARTSSDPFVFGIPMIYPYLSVPAGALYALVQAVLSAAIMLTAAPDEVRAQQALPKGI